MHGRTLLKAELACQYLLKHVKAIDSSGHGNLAESEKILLFLTQRITWLHSAVAKMETLLIDSQYFWKFPFFHVDRIRNSSSETASTPNLPSTFCISVNIISKLFQLLKRRLRSNIIPESTQSQAQSVESSSSCGNESHLESWIFCTDCVGEIRGYW